MSDDRQLRDLALVAAQVGAHTIGREQRGGALRIDTKANPQDFVTNADRAAETAILSTIAAVRPDDAVLAEESGEHPGTSGVRWVVDPLDGTTNFVHGRRDFAVSVGVERDGRVVAGAVVRPHDGDWAAAGAGEGVARHGAPRTSATHDLRDALVGIGLPAPGAGRRRIHAFVGDLIPHVRDYRRIGSSACELLAVALGEQDGYLGFGVHLWDVAAGIALVEAAGGTCTWVSGPGGVRGFVAGTPAVVEALVARLEATS